MRTGDTVFHGPTEETWRVAFVDDARGELVPCGWPLCFARVEDCTLCVSATDEESEALLQQLAAMHTGSHHDARQAWAARKLRERSSPAPGPAKETP